MNTLWGDLIPYVCSRAQYAEGSTVVDMTKNPPELLRRGLGDASVFEALLEDLVPA